MAAQLSKWKKARAGMETIFKLRHASFLQDYDGKPDWYAPLEHQFVQMADELERQLSLEGSEELMPLHASSRNSQDLMAAAADHTEEEDTEAEMILQMVAELGQRHRRIDLLGSGLERHLSQLEMAVKGSRPAGAGAVGDSRESSRGGSPIRALTSALPMPARRDEGRGTSYCSSSTVTGEGEVLSEEGSRVRGGGPPRDRRGSGALEEVCDELVGPDEPGLSSKVRSTCPLVAYSAPLPASSHPPSSGGAHPSYPTFSTKRKKAQGEAKLSTSVYWPGLSDVPVPPTNL